MRAAGLPVDADLVVTGTGFTEAEGARLCRALLERGADFTAALAGNDLLALGCIDALREAGLDCPLDVSVVGFNDMPFADRFDPPLTTVRIPHREIGAAAAELLLERLADGEREAEQLMLAPSFAVRRSTAPPRDPSVGA